ncbi:MAG: Npt1/Npt2 family nucleotide transporter [Waddliaceae bacterium]
MSESSPDDKSFGPIRQFLWPIHRHEMKKLIPMLLIFFLVHFSYNILRTLKDTLIVTAKCSGVEAIAFIKVWVMFPGAILMTFLFTRLSNRFSRETVFYVMMSIFLLTFFLFGFFLYPLRESIHPHAFADFLQEMLPAGCKGFIAMFRNWTFTLFYGMSELWGNIIIFVLFWGFANEITTINEAKRFYGLLGFGANLSGVIAGLISVFISRRAFNPHLPFGETGWEQSLVLLISLVILSGVLSLGLFRWLNRKFLLSSHNELKKFDENNAIKGKLSLRKNFAYLLKSNYLIYIALIVISYSVVINLIELVWKDRMKALYPSPSDYNLYFNQVSMIIGITATLASLFLSGNVLRKYGWTFTAMLTPLIVLFTSLVFFGLFFTEKHLPGPAAALFGFTPLMLIVLSGSIQNIFSRAAKYTVFDITKEVAFVPLTTESKLKGKAAIDGVCNRLGKCGGSVIHTGLLFMCTTFTVSAPYVMVMIIVVIGIWMLSIRFLGKEFDLLSGTQKQKAPLVEELPERRLHPTEHAALVKEQIV